VPAGVKILGSSAPQFLAQPYSLRLASGSSSSTRAGILDMAAGQRGALLLAARTG